MAHTVRAGNDVIKPLTGERRTMATVTQLNPAKPASDKPASAKASQPKDLYDIGEIPPLGHVPEKMHA